MSTPSRERSTPVRAPLAVVCDHRGEGTIERALALVESGWRVVTSSNVQASLQVLRGERPDVVVFDPLAVGGGRELLAVVRARGGPADEPPPLLYVADPSDPDAGLEALEGLELAARDLVLRGASPRELSFRVERLVEAARRERDRARWRHRACHDDRTELLRPSVFEARLAEHFSGARRHGHELGLVLVDLDRFGAINKTYDHTVGDRLIERVGAIVREGLRTEDVAGRLGGDEFGVVLPYTGRIESAQVVARLRRRLRSFSVRRELADHDPVRVSVTASLGFETYDGADLDDVSELRAHAEEALRLAKRRGGDRAVYYRTMQSVEEPGADEETGEDGPADGPDVEPTPPEPVVVEPTA